jgi:hypothetical protein
MATNPNLSAAEPFGVIFYRGSANFGGGYPSNNQANHWLVASSEASIESYATLKSRLIDAGELVDLNKNCDEKDISLAQDGTFLCKNLRIKKPWNIGTKKIIVLADDDINLDDPISVGTGGFLLLATAKDIKIDKKIVSLHGFYLAQGQIITNDKGSNKSLLTVQGGLIGLGGFDLGREVDDFTTPSELFIYRPDLWFNVPTVLNTWQTGSWQELTP